MEKRTKEMLVPVKLVSDILQYCKDKQIYDKLGNYHDFYYQLHLLFEKENNKKRVNYGDYVVTKLPVWEDEINVGGIVGFGSWKSKYEMQIARIDRYRESDTDPMAFKVKLVPMRPDGVARSWYSDILKDKEGCKIFDSIEDAEKYLHSLNIV